MFEVPMKKETLNAPLTKLFIQMFSADSRTLLSAAKSANEVQLKQGSSQPADPGEINPTPTPRPKGKRHLN
jgi:hypothetical protein